MLLSNPGTTRTAVIRCKFYNDTNTLIDVQDPFHIHHAMSYIVSLPTILLPGHPHLHSLTLLEHALQAFAERVAMIELNTNKGRQRRNAYRKPLFNDISFEKQVMSHSLNSKHKHYTH